MYLKQRKGRGTTPFKLYLTVSHLRNIYVINCEIPISAVYCHSLFPALSCSLAFLNNKSSKKGLLNYLTVSSFITLLRHEKCPLWFFTKELITVKLPILPSGVLVNKRSSASFFAWMIRLNLSVIFPSPHPFIQMQEAYSELLPTWLNEEVSNFLLFTAQGKDHRF